MLKHIVETVCTVRDEDGSISVVGFYVLMLGIMLVLFSGFAIPALLLQ